MKIKKFNLFVIIILSTVSLGCGMPITKTTLIHPGPDISDTRPVKVFREGDPVAVNYEILGVTSLLSSGEERWDSPQTYLQSEAASIGADALVGFYHKFVNEDPTLVFQWATALAVRTLQGEKRPASSTANFIVKIPHTFIEGEVASGNKAEVLDKMARESAQFYFAQKGYYTILTDEPRPDVLKDSATSKDVSHMVQFSGTQANFILLINFSASKTSTIILSSAEEITINVSLFSNSQNKIIWQSNGSGSGTTGWIINLADSNVKGLMATRVAINQALASLPDISTKTTGG